jgi:hypothetical protein
MYDQPQEHLPKEAPLERIFRKIIGRKMTGRERVSFHIKTGVKPVKRKPN